MSNVFKALGDPTRRKVLQLLRQQPMSAGELADHFEVSKPTMSAHFAVLLGADLIQVKKAAAQSFTVSGCPCWKRRSWDSHRHSVCN